MQHLEHRPAGDGEIMSTPRVAGFGFSTIGERPDLSDLDRALGRIEETGASHCELSFCDGDLIAGASVIPDRRRQLEAICARRQLRFTAHGALTVNFMDEANLELHKAVCRANLELAGVVGATIMVHHPGVIPIRPAHELDRLHALERDCLREMGDSAGKLGLRIAVETLFVENEAEYTADPVRLAGELRAIAHPQVVGTLDVSHSYIMTSFRGTSFQDAVAAFAPVTGHFHLHDSFGRPNRMGELYTQSEMIAYGLGDLHLPFGWGDIPFETLLPGLPVLPGSILNVELPARYWSELDACAGFARRLLEMMNLAVD
jgi:sugar phosphate isomerase/epimerase